MHVLPQFQNEFIQSQKEIENFFNHHAHNWDQHITEDLMNTVEKLLDKVEIREGDIIADVGCGTGILFPYLMRRTGYKSRLIEIDLSPEMIFIGSQKYAHPGCLWTVVDAHFLPLKDQSIDTLICFAVFPHLTDKNKAITEHARVLRQGGQWVVCHARSSREINEFHKKIGGIVAEHLIPPVEQIEKLLHFATLKISYFQDTDDGYLLIANK